MYEFSKKGRHRDLLNLFYERIPMGFLPLNLLIVNELCFFFILFSSSSICCCSFLLSNSQIFHLVCLAVASKKTQMVHGFKVHGDRVALFP